MSPSPWGTCWALKSQSCGQRAAPSAVPSCPLVPSSVLEFCTHPPPLLAPGTIHCFLCFGFPSLGHVEMLPHTALSPSLFTAAFLSFSFFCFTPLLFSFFFPFPQASHHRLLQTFPCKLFILPLPLPHPNLLLLLSCLGCVVWVVGTKSGHAKPHQCHFIPLIPAFHPPLCRRACLPAHGCVLAVGWLWSSAPTLWLIYTFLGQLILHSAPE